MTNLVKKAVLSGAAITISAIGVGGGVLAYDGNGSSHTTNAQTYAENQMHMQTSMHHMDLGKMMVAADMFHGSMQSYQPASMTHMHDSDGHMAVAAFKTSVYDATKKYVNHLHMINGHSMGHDMKVDALNRARAEYFNELEIAKNHMAAKLSNMDHHANVVKDEMINYYGMKLSKLNYDLSMSMYS